MLQYSRSPPITRPIQTAINAWKAGDEIWVAQGAYKENLTLKPGVRLKGGYNASYTAQNWTQWPSIIDGDQKSSVVIGADKALLDGFTIHNGKAKCGGGVYVKGVVMQIRTSLRFVGSSMRRPVVSRENANAD